MIEAAFVAERILPRERSLPTLRQEANLVPKYFVVLVTWIIIFWRGGDLPCFIVRRNSKFT
jgi:hypothetical protein